MAHIKVWSLGLKQMIVVVAGTTVPSGCGLAAADRRGEVTHQRLQRGAEPQRGWRSRSEHASASTGAQDRHESVRHLSSCWAGSQSAATDLILLRPQKHVDQGQFPEFMPKDTIMQQHDWWVLLHAACSHADCVEGIEAHTAGISCRVSASGGTNKPQHWVSS